MSGMSSILHIALYRESVPSQRAEMKKGNSRSGRSIP